MRCFYVLVHGKLEWECEHEENEEMFTPAGFYCPRYVLASGYEDAVDRAFNRVRKNLEKQTGWMRQGLAKLTLEATELKPAPMYMLLRRRRKVKDFYEANAAELAE